MKRLFCLLIVLSLFPLTHYSQIIESYGLKLGTALSSPTWTKDSQTDSKIQSKYGLDIGGFVRVKLLNNISIIPELHFVQKGFQYPIETSSIFNPNATKIYYTTKSSANYLSVPINISWSFHKSSMETYIIGGIHFDFIVSRNGDYWQYYYDRFKNVTIGLTTGIGVQTSKLIGIGTGLEFRYSPSIVDSYYDGYEQIRNKSFEFLFMIFK